MINDTKEIQQILKDAKTVAMIGCSPNEYRTSNYAARFLREKGYRVIPINPEAEEIDGEKSYNNLSDLPEDIQIDIVNVFRNSRYSADATQDVADWKAETGQDPVVWTQLDVSSPDAEKIAEQKELPYIKNRCIMVEYDRMVG
ncbi:MAG TPA: CoA-binding protein [Balneolaceae bacterium]|nr:CoA-binding protein [Balneola sp.]HBQ61663.1 CoA-binding protein [Balneolaceae bacterium]|tara:strand:- start:197157 stop:197585 length:429 start_codon:yes stop_codon:yes gene_type:complete